MAVGCTEQVAVPQIEWVAMEEQWPPIGVEVLACGVGKEFGGIHTNQLDKGSDIGPGYDPELYYWAGGEDFDEVTHWAPMPAMPPADREAPTVSLAPETEYLLSGQGDHQEWMKLRAFCAAPPGGADTVKVPRIVLMEAESIIESYAEALRAGHPLRGGQGDKDVAQDGCGHESKVAAELRDLLAGGDA